MDFKTFFYTIKKHGNIPSSPPDIVEELYHYVDNPISEHTAEAYYKGVRTSKIERGRLYESGFFQYFQERTHTTWRNIQGAFENLGQPTLINYSTENENEFYESLLSEFYEIVRSGPTSLRHILPARPKNFGREKEIELIKSSILKEKVVVLTGVGGIGKSHLALECAYHLSKDNRMLCQHLVCEDNGTVRDAICKLQFDNPNQSSKQKRGCEQYSDRLLWLKNRNHPTLIILDNLNHALTKDDRKALTELINCGTHIHILITTRNRKVSDGLPVIQIQPLDNDTLLNLYAYHRIEDERLQKQFIEKHRTDLFKMFATFGGHTLMTILFAKLPRRTLMSEFELHKRLVHGLSLPHEPVSLQKGLNYIEDSTFNIIRFCFNISRLTKQEKYALGCMTLMPFQGVDISFFEKHTGCNRKTILSLIDSGWIILDDAPLLIKLHPLICEVILSYEELIPSVDLCQKFLNMINPKKATLLQAQQEETSVQTITERDVETEKVAYVIDDYYLLEPIRASILSRINFRRIVNYGATTKDAPCGFFNYLDEEYKEALLSLNDCVIKISNKT